MSSDAKRPRKTARRRIRGRIGIVNFRHLASGLARQTEYRPLYFSCSLQADVENLHGERAGIRRKVVAVKSVQSIAEL
jgi:hypothetical protein